MRDVAVGVALTLSIVAFILALWPAVADAPWETQEIQITVEPAPVIASDPGQDFQSDPCMILAQTETQLRTQGAYILSEMRRLGCIE